MDKEVKPYRVSIPKVFALGLSIIIIGILCAQIHAVLSIAIPLYIIAAIMSLVRHNMGFSFSLIFTTADWSEDFSFISVQTKIQQPQKQCKVFKPLLKHIHRGSQGDFLFNLRGKMYSCNRSGVKEINDADRLKMLEIENLDKYSKMGLQGELLTKSINLFGKSVDLFEPNIFTILSRFFWEQTGWIFASFLALIAGVVFSLKRNQKLILLLYLAIHTLAFMLVFIQMCFRKYHFHSYYKQLSQKMYYVIREGKEIRVNLSDLLIGDVVRVKFQDQKKEMMVYFRGVLLCNQDLEVRQGKQGKQAFKKPLKECKHLEQLKRRQRHTLYAGTKISNSLNQKYVNILVTDRTLNNNFKSWFEKPHQREYEPITKRIQIQKIKLLIAGSGLLIGFYLLRCLQLGRGLLQGAKSLNFSLLFAAIPLCFIPNQLVILMTTFRMNYNQIILLQSDLQKVSFCPKIFIDDFKRELNFKFSEMLYKNKILKFKNEDFKPDLQAMRAASSYDSQLALIIYISFGKFEKQYSFLGKTFQKFEKEFQFDVSQSETLVIHKSSNKKWTVQKTFPLDDRGMRSWIVQFDNKATYLISQLNQVNDSIFNLLCNREDSNKKDRYADEAKLQSDQGKQIKAMFFRNFKNQQLRDSIAIEIDLKKEPRQNLQIRFQFGTFLVFDNSLPESISVAINEIKKESIKGQILVEPVFLTQEGSEALQGLEHYLPGVPIRYNCSSMDKEKQIRESISKYGTIFIGNTDHNYELHSMVDFAGQLTKSEQKNNFPTDVLMKNATQIQDLLSYSRWVLQSRIQNIKLGFFYVIFSLIGEIYKSNTLITRSQTQQIKDITNLVLFTIFASILRQFVTTRPNTSKHMKHITIFSPNFYISLISFIFSAIIWISFRLKEKLCQNQNSSFSRQSIEFQCVDIDQLLGGWAGILFFCVFYSEQSWIIGEDWGRLLITPLWLLLLYLNNVALSICLGLLIGLLVVLGSKKVWRLSRQCF